MAHDRGPTVFTVALIMIALATVFTILRLVSKWGITKKSNPDDWLVLVGWVSTDQTIPSPLLCLEIPQ